MGSVRTRLGLVAVAMVMAGCVSSPRFTMAGKELPPPMASVGPSYTEEGIASYYAEEFNGRKTSNGETYDMHRLTAAHRTLPFKTLVRVTNTNSGRSVVVRINDRGPFKDNRIIDVSLAAAKAIEMIGTGTAPVRLELAPDSTETR
jgi:rare lipoprotein A